MPRYLRRELPGRMTYKGVEREALEEEFEFGLNTLTSGETVEGATAFKEGSGRHGETV